MELMRTEIFLLLFINIKIMKKIFLFLFIVVAPNLIIAQITIVQSDFSPGGEFVTSESITAITNIGEVVRYEYSNDLLYVSEGFIHPEMLVFVSSLNRTLDYDIHVFPNPTKDFIYLSGLKDLNCDFKLVNHLGDQVAFLIQLVSENSVKMDLSQLISGVYYLTVIYEGVQMTYKIIKL